MDPFMLFFFTELASTQTFILASALITLYLFHRRGWRSALAFVMSCTALVIAIVFLKEFTHVERPPNGLVYASGYAFPSGHAGGAAFLALMIVFLNRYQRPRLYKLIGGGAILLALCIGFSRISLQVHTPFQVAVGFVLGAFFAFLWYWTEEHLYEHPTGLLRKARRHRKH